MQLTKGELLELATPREKDRVAIYMPVEEAADSFAHNRLVLKNLLDKAEHELVTRGSSPREAGAMLAYARKFVTDDRSWSTRKKGLGIIFEPDITHWYWLPYPVPRSVDVGTIVPVKPLIPLLEPELSYHVLVVSKGGARLLSCAADETEETTLTPTAPSTDEIGSDSSEEEQLQHFFVDIGKQVSELVRDSKAPIVLACVHELANRFRAMADGLNIVDGQVEGNHDHTSADELAKAAWPMARPAADHEWDAAADRIREETSREDVVVELEAVVPSVVQGRVDRMFVAMDRQCRGDVDPESYRVHLYDDAESRGRDLLEYAALETLKYGGHVRVVPESELPGETNIAALLRF